MPKTPPANNGKTQKNKKNNAKSAKLMTAKNSRTRAAELLKKIRSEIEGKNIGPQMANVNKFAAILQEHPEDSQDVKDFIQIFRNQKGKYVLIKESKSAKAETAPVSISLKTIAKAMKERNAPGAGAAAAPSKPATTLNAIRAQIAALKTLEKEERAKAAAEKKIKQEFAHLEEQAAKNLAGLEIDEHNFKRLAHIRGLGVPMSGDDFIKVKKAFSRKYMTKKVKSVKAANKTTKTENRNGNARSANGNAKSTTSGNGNASEFNLGE
jgi:hypothetical protein